MERRVPNTEGKGPWRYLGQNKTKYVYEYAYHVPSGYSVKDLQKEIDALYATCGALVELTDRAGVVIVNVFRTDMPAKIKYDSKHLELSDGKSVLMGYNRKMEPITHSFSIPHMLVAGQSGYGKTDALRWIMYQLITRFSPEQLEIHVIDMKRFSFFPFQKVQHVTRIETTLDGALNVLEDGYNTMNERAEMVIKSGNREITKDFKWRLVIIDEASQIAPGLALNREEKKFRDKATGYACAISAVGREAGVGLIYATQYPTKDVIHGQIKANMEAVLCFKTENDTHSNVALDRNGAETINVRGRAIYKNRGEFTLVQVPFISDDDAYTKLLSPYYREKVRVIDTTGTEETDFVGDAFDSTDHFYGPSSKEIISWEWLPTEKSVRDPIEIRAGEVDRGKT